MLDFFFLSCFAFAALFCKRMLKYIIEVSISIKNTWQHNGQCLKHMSSSTWTNIYANRIVCFIFKFIKPVLSFRLITSSRRNNPEEWILSGHMCINYNGNRNRWNALHIGGTQSRSHFQRCFVWFSCWNFHLTMDLSFLTNCQRVQVEEHAHGTIGKM